EEYMNLPRGSHASTFGGNPISCAVACAVIDVIREENLLQNAEKQGEYIIKRFKELQEKYEMIGDVRGKGLMIGVELVKDRKSKTPAVKEQREILQQSFKKGLLIISAGISTLRIAPPLIISREAVDKALEILDGIFKHTLK
ncbi:MAG: aspartate aminotransferase family protein, partial [Thermoprotei archaeon]